MSVTEIVEAAQFITIAGHEMVLLDKSAWQEVMEWLEVMEDATELEQAIQEDDETISWEQVKAEYLAARRVAERIEDLAANPRLHGAEKLSGAEGYRLRVGDYRVLYTINDAAQVVTIYRVKHRREAYR